MLLIYRLLGNGVFLGAIDAISHHPSCCVLDQLRDLAKSLAWFFRMETVSG